MADRNRWDEFDTAELEALFDGLVAHETAREVYEHDRARWSLRDELQFEIQRRGEVERDLRSEPCS